MVTETLTFTKITMLALADSVNPCAIAVLAMILMGIMIHNPKNKKRVLYSGLAFVASVYLGYVAYGLIITQFFRSFAETLRVNSAYIYNGLGIFAMVLGALNIKDYFKYKKGGMGTEMPMFLRPKVKRVVDNITSPSGAFTIGFFVTLFLLPCTIGPYIVASGILSSLGFLGAIPWLLYYNLLFVIPMLFIVLLVSFSVRKVEEVSGWQRKNIRRLHLASGLLLFLVGVALVARWI